MSAQLAPKFISTRLLHIRNYVLILVVYEAGLRTDCYGAGRRDRSSDTEIDGTKIPAFAIRGRSPE